MYTLYVNCLSFCFSPRHFFWHARCLSCVGRHSSFVSIPPRTESISSQVEALQQPLHLHFTVQCRDHSPHYTWTLLLFQLKPPRGLWMWCKIFLGHIILLVSPMLLIVKYWLSQANYMLYQHPSCFQQCLREINNMIKTGRSQNKSCCEIPLDQEGEGHPSAKRLRTDDHSAWQRRLQEVVNDRAMGKSQAKPSQGTKPM